MTRLKTAAAVMIVAAAAPLLAQRFDNLVRSDFFAGFRGDSARLAKAMAFCEKTIADDPRNAAALVWHGAGLFYPSGEKLRQGDWKAGLDMQNRGLKEMDDAVAMRPDDLQTIIPRGS